MMYLHPTINIVLMSYNTTYASHRVVNIITTLKRLGIKPNPMRKGKFGYETQTGASITPAGIATGYTGRPADITIIDDPVRTLDDVLSTAHMESTLRTFKGVTESREQNNSSIIITHTRWHKNDLIGWVLKERSRYSNINIPVITDGVPLLPSFLNLEMIGYKQKELGGDFNAMYMGQPPDSMSAIFRSEVDNKPLPKYYTNTPNEYDSFAIGGDLAYTDKTRADYSVIVTGYKSGEKIYIESVERWQRDFNYTREKLKQVYDKHQTPIQLEYNGVQKGIVDTVISDGVHVNKQKVDASKYTRALEFSAQWNLGNVYIKKADWNDVFLKEVFNFTGSGKEHDDIIDALVYLFRALSRSLSFA